MNSCQASQVALLKLEELIQTGDIHDYRAYLERVKRMGLEDQVAEAEKKLELKRSEVSTWLTRAVRDWNENRANIYKNMEEAKRLGMEDVISTTETALSAREKLVTEGLEISLAEGLKVTFDRWMKHAQNLGLDDIMDRYQSAFLEKAVEMTAVLMEAATSGTKDEFLAASDKAKFLGLDSEVGRGSSIFRNRVSEVMSMVIDLVRSQEAHEWDNIRLQTRYLGIGWDVIENLRDNVLHSEGVQEDRSSVYTSYVEKQGITSKTNMGEQRSNATVDIPLWSMMQNWKQTEILRRNWQNYMINKQDNDPDQIEVDVSDPLGCCDNSKHILPDDESDSEERQLIDNTWTQTSRADENREMDAVLSIPLILTRLTMEQKMNCSGDELHFLPRIDINDEGLSELGQGNISEWCPRVKVLTCDMNRLTSLRGAFLGCEEILEHISARNNFITDISDLVGLRSLESLRLDGNYLSNLRKTEYPSTPTTSVGWPRLKELRLSCNRITRLPPMGSLCPRLQILDMGSNHLVTLKCGEGNALSGLRSLKMLDVGQNRLKGQSLWDGLRHCPLLISLVASRNRLTELPTFCGSVLLRELWLNGNSIRRLACSAWMPNLQRLYLQDNSIETLEPLWGCPALEVLDLSFNSISDLAQLRQLACFIHLRTLQLNDNPVSEQADYIDTVLEAVPWLLELDNEAVTERSKNRVVKRIFTNVMKNVGMKYLHDKFSKQEIVTSDAGLPNEIHSIYVGYDTQKLSWFDRLHYDSVNSAGGKSHEKVTLKAFQNGSADRAILWSALFEVGLLESTRSALRGLVRSTDDKGLEFSEDMEAKTNVFSMQEMCTRQREKLLLANKDLRDVSDNDSETCSRQTCLDSSVQSKFGRGFDGPELCLHQHLSFCGQNKASRKEGMTRRLQTYIRDYLTRSKVRLCNKAAGTIQAAWKLWKFLSCYSTWPDSESRKAGISLIVKVQAAWRGHIFRQKYRTVLAKSKYIDEDRFDYGAIDEEEFSASELPDLLLGPDFCPSLSVERGDNFLQIVRNGQASRYPWSDNDHGMADNDVQEGEVYQAEEKRRIQMEQIAKDWGFEDEKTVKQFLKARKKVKKQQRAAKPPPPADSQKRLEMFKAKPDIPTEHSQIRQHLENMFTNINRRSNNDRDKPSRDVVKTIVYPFAVPSH